MIGLVITLAGAFGSLVAYFQAQGEKVDALAARIAAEEAQAAAEQAVEIANEGLGALYFKEIEYQVDRLADSQERRWSCPFGDNQQGRLAIAGDSATGPTTKDCLDMAQDIAAALPKLADLVSASAPYALTADRTNTVSEFCWHWELYSEDYLDLGAWFPMPMTPLEREPINEAAKYLQWYSTRCQPTEIGGQYEIRDLSGSPP